MEAPRHAMLQFDPRDRRAREVLRVENDHLAAVARLVVPDGEHPAVVLGRLGVARYEQRLSRREIFPEVLNLGLAGLIIAFEQTLGRIGVLRRFGIAVGEVTVAMLAAGEALVEARKLGKPVMQLTLPHRAVLQIQIPAPDERLAAERVAGHVERIHPASVDDKLTVLFVRIEEMKNEERLVLEPFHVAGLAVHHADFGAVLWLPDEQRLARRHVLEMEDGRTDE